MIALVSIALLFLSLAESLSPIYVSDEAPQSVVQKHLFRIITYRGGNATLPCKLNRGADDFSSSSMRIKWSKLSPDLSQEVEVLVAMGTHKKMYNGYQGRAFLQEEDETDASLILTNIQLEDVGKYRCEVIDGMDDATDVVTLELKGVVFPYSPRLGRYNMNYYEAEKACLAQDAVVASFDQLYQAWKEGMDWCNAGWLNDGTVQYPINTPRGPCGGNDSAPGVRSYGRRDKDNSRFDVFCFTANFEGRFYYLEFGNNVSALTYDEAFKACETDGAMIASVGHMYSAWKLLSYDRCDAGWLSDGSVRYPITRPRRRCSPTEAAVRFVGFPDKTQTMFGVYCYRPF